MSTAFQSNAFQTTAFQIDSTDTHDGYSAEEDELLRQQVQARADAYRASKERLRSDLILAMEGPQESEAIEVLRDAIPAELAKAAPDYEPDLRAMLSDMRSLEHIARLALNEERRRFEEDEEEVEFLLLQ